MTVRLEVGDEFFTRSETLRGWLIRVFQRMPGEPRTLVNHVGIVVRGGTLAEAEIVEALGRVRRIGLLEAYGGGSSRVAIYRVRGLSADQREAIASKAESYVGRRYGYLKVAADFGDWWVSRAFGADVYFFRRLAKMDRYPHCSWVAEHALAAGGIVLGPEGQTPDDLWDAARAQWNRFELVRGLELLPSGG